MATYYFDSSALIKNYVDEVGSDWVRNLLKEQNENLFITSLITLPEVYSAFNRRLREGTVTDINYQININAFHDDLKGKFHLLSLSAEIINNTRNLIENHALRANDALQLTSAITANESLIKSNLPSIIFVSADLRLNNAAESENLLSKDPKD